jgi:GNAT superfamily N-acetyltransferase/O-methyltransferase involved in polyketide biosynthesis
MPRSVSNVGSESNVGSVSNVSRTALDSLKAKHSAICSAGYPILSPFPIEHRRPSRDDRENDENNVLEDEFRRLLDAMLEKLERVEAVASESQRRSRRRQTPLVNSGYAMRVSTVVSTILNFARYHSCHQRGLDDATEHQSPSNDEIQIVMLGAGLDVTGLWSMSALNVLLRIDDGDNTDVAAQLYSSSPKIRVVEIDTPEICRIKGPVLAQMEQLIVQTDNREDQPSEGKGRDGFVMSAIRRTNRDGSTEQDDDAPTSSYVLLELDLTDSVANLERVLTPWLKRDLPTLFVSELVLTYLGDDPVDRLLRWLNDTYVQRTESSAILAFEPLGPRDSGPQKKSILEGCIATSYRAAYYQQFASKLSQGSKEGDHRDDEQAHTSSFHPLGSSIRDIERRMKGLGFTHVNVSLAGSVVRSISSFDQWTSREPFDEHAALALHLRSYVVVCAFGDKSSSSVFRQVLCPWIADGCPPVFASISSDGVAPRQVRQRMWITKVNHHDDEKSIRALFLETYRDLAEEHTSIRKMVKTALKTDLASSPVASLAAAQPSQVHSLYQKKGGFFLVAILPVRNADKSTWEHHVVGAIGVRRLGSDELHARGMQSASATAAAAFEIHRLMVDASFQRQQIGTLLLDRAKDLTARFHVVRTPATFQLVATTPALLEGANTFYASHGFSVAQTMQVGELQLVTHVAEVLS